MISDTESGGKRGQVTAYLLLRNQRNQRPRNTLKLAQKRARFCEFREVCRPLVSYTRVAAGWTVTRPQSRIGAISRLPICAVINQNRGQRIAHGTSIRAEEFLRRVKHRLGYRRRNPICTPCQHNVQMARTYRLRMLCGSRVDGGSTDPKLDSRSQPKYGRCFRNPECAHHGAF